MCILNIYVCVCSTLCVHLVAVLKIIVAVQKMHGMGSFTVVCFVLGFDTCA